MVGGAFCPGQSGDELLPPGLAVGWGAKDARSNRVVDEGRFLAARERTHLLVAGCVPPSFAAVRADVLLHQLLARVLVHADARAVKPVLAAVARDHEAVIIWPATETVGAAVGLRVPVIITSCAATATATGLFGGGICPGPFGSAGFGLLSASWGAWFGAFRCFDCGCCAFLFLSSSGLGH